MTQLILYTCEDGDSVVKESLTTQNRVGPAAGPDHFRGVKKMVAHGKGNVRRVNDEATQ